MACEHTQHRHRWGEWNILGFGMDKLNHNPFAEAARELKAKLQAETQEREEVERARAKAAAAQPRPDPADEIRAEPEDEEALFRRHMSGVSPMDGKQKVPLEQQGRVPRTRDREAEAMAELADLVSGQGDFDVNNSDEYIEGISQGLDRRLLKKLRRGFFALQAHLDLHGRTRAEAKEMVARFLETSRVERRRCVLIVHGRGLNSKDQIPVLKEGLRVWLSRGRIGRSVLAFCTAQPTDGGAGAVYVLLRK